MPETEIRNAICTHPLKLEGGAFPLPTQPGISTDLVFDALEGKDEYRFKPQPPSNRTEPPRH